MRKNTDSIVIIIIAIVMIFAVFAISGKKVETNSINNNNSTITTPDEQTPDGQTPDVPVYNFEDWTVNYLPNGGDGEIISGSIAPDIGFTIRNSSTFTREGYTLTSWNTKADGTGDTFICGQTVIVLSQGQTQPVYGGQEPETYTVEHCVLILYAQWEQIEE